MNTLNKIIRAFKAPVPMFDRMLEIAALVFMVVIFTFTVYLYQQAPEQIATKFDVNGNPIDWADKAIFWYMSAFFIVMMVCSAGAAYDVNLKFTHVAFRLKEPVKAAQQRLIGRMSRCVTICMGLMWLSYLLHASSSFMEIPVLATIFSRLTMLVLLAVIIFFSVKAWWIGRHY